MSAPPQRPQNRPRRSANNVLDTQEKPVNLEFTGEQPSCTQCEEQSHSSPAGKNDTSGNDGTSLKGSITGQTEQESKSNDPVVECASQQARPTESPRAENSELEMALETAASDSVSPRDTSVNCVERTCSAGKGPDVAAIDAAIEEKFGGTVSPRSKPVESHKSVPPVEMEVSTNSQQPSPRQNSLKTVASDAVLSPGASSKSTSKRPLGSKVGQLRNTLFADLNSALARGPAAPAVSAAPVSPQIEQQPTIMQGATESQSAPANPSAARARGPRRRLPVSATPQLQTVSAVPLWRTERIPRATAPPSPALGARNSIAGLNTDTILTRNNSAVDVAKFVMSTAEPQRQISRTDLPALSKLVDPAVTGSLQHADAHAAGAHAHSLGASGSSAPSQGFLAAMATMPEMFAPPRIQRELQEANRRQRVRTANAQGANVKFRPSDDCIEPGPGSGAESISGSEAATPSSPQPEVVLPPSEVAMLMSPTKQIENSESEGVFTESDGQESVEGSKPETGKFIQKLAASDTQAAPEVDVSATVPTNALAEALSRVEVSRPLRPATRPQRKPRD